MFLFKPRPKFSKEIKNFLYEKELLIDQLELKNGFLKNQFNLDPNSLVSFFSKQVKSTNLEKKPSFLNFVAEIHVDNLKEALYLQRIFALIIENHLPPNICRINNDFYLLNLLISKKFFAYSKNSVIIHFSFMINLLMDAILSYDPDFTLKPFAVTIMQSYCTEVNNLNNVGVV